MLFVLINPAHIASAILQAPVSRQILTGSAFQARRRSVKIRQEWRLHVPHFEQAELDRFFGFYASLQQDTTFWFDGAGAGQVTDIFVSTTDGSQTEFLLPHDNVDPSSLICKANGTVKTDWILTGSTGALAFTTAPAAGTLTASYWCKFLCVFNAGDEGFAADRFFRGSNGNHTAMDITIQEVATP